MGFGVLDFPVLAHNSWAGTEMFIPVDRLSVFTGFCFMEFTLGKQIFTSSSEA